MMSFPPIPLHKMKGLGPKSTHTTRKALLVARFIRRGRAGMKANREKAP